MLGVCRPMELLGVGVAMFGALLLEVSPNWVTALVFPALALWPGDPRGHALRLWSHLREAGSLGLKADSAWALLPRQLWQIVLGLLTRSPHPESVLPTQHLRPWTSGESSGH